MSSTHSSLRRLALALLLLCLMLPLAAVAQPSADTAPEASVASSPIMFIENVGQFDDAVRFKVMGASQQAWLTDDGLWLTVVAPVERDDGPEGELFGDDLADAEPRGAVAIRLSFADANAKATFEPLAPVETKVSYFIGDDPDGWQADVPVYNGVRWAGLYDGLDLEMRCEDGRFQWELVPHASLAGRALREAVDQVALAVEGAEIAVDGGSLIIKTELGDVRWPLLESDAAAGEPSVSGGVVRAPFGLAAECEAALLDDPSELIYGTFLGGLDHEFTRAIAADGAGNAYVTGWTSSSSFPTTPGVPGSTHSGGDDAFVAKLNPYGTSLLYATFLGSSGYDKGHAIRVDGAGNAYVAGETTSSTFPTTPGVWDTIYNASSDGFVCKLSATGTNLLYSTYFGGDGYEVPRGLAIDAYGNAYVTGRTQSSDFPTTPGAWDRTYYGGGGDYGGDAFVLKLNGAASHIVYSTFLGGNDTDFGLGIDVDSQGNAFVVGSTDSTDFPTSPLAFDTTLDGGDDAFLAKLSATGSDLLISTYVGGSSADTFMQVAVDAAGNIHAAGSTKSGDFPTTVGAWDRSLASYNTHDAVVVKLSASGRDLIYGTYYGGGETDYGYDLALDEQGNAYVTGLSKSVDLPTTPGSLRNGYAGGMYDAYLAKFNAAGTSLLYATYLGGDDSDIGDGVALVGDGQALVTGNTFSEQFPTTLHAYDSSHNGEYDAFVVKLDTGESTTPTLTPTGSRAPTNSPTPTRTRTPYPGPYPYPSPYAYPSATPTQRHSGNCHLPMIVAGSAPTPIPPTLTPTPSNTPYVPPTGEVEWYYHPDT